MKKIMILFLVFIISTGIFANKIFINMSLKMAKQLNSISKSRGGLEQYSSKTLIVDLPSLLEMRQKLNQVLGNVDLNYELIKTLDSTLGNPYSSLLNTSYSPEMGLLLNQKALSFKDTEKEKQKKKAKNKDLTKICFEYGYKGFDKFCQEDYAISTIISTLNILLDGQGQASINFVSVTDDKKNMVLKMYINR